VASYYGRDGRHLSNEGKKTLVGVFSTILRVTGISCPVDLGVNF